MGEFITLYLTARDAPDKETAKALGKVVQTLINDLPNALKLIQDGVQKGDLDKTGDKHDKLIKAVEDRITIEPVSDLEKFFSGVTQAVVGAQEDLNQQSLEYIDRLPRQQDGHPLIPPSYFAIPSVRAEMKVGISQVKGKGINIIIFNKKEQQENYSESTISFEVVSTPAPPSVQLPPVSSPPDETLTLKPQSLSPKLTRGVIKTLSHSWVQPFTETVMRRTVSDSTSAEDLVQPLTFLNVSDFDFSNVSDFDVRDAVLAERERALDIREDWLDVRSRLLGKRTLLLGDRAVLDFIRSELHARGLELGKLYENTEDLALILSYTKQERTGYLVLWPGRAESDRRETWRELRVFHLVREGNALAFDTSLFETAPAEGFLLVTSRKELLRLSPGEVADLSINLGDALMNIVLVFNEWLKDE